MADFKYAVLTLEWNYEQLAPQVAIVHGLTNTELEDVIDHMEVPVDPDEDEPNLWARDVVRLLRDKGYRVDVPEEILQYDDFNGCYMRGNKEEDLVDDGE